MSDPAQDVFIEGGGERHRVFFNMAKVRKIEERFGIEDIEDIGDILSGSVELEDIAAMVAVGVMEREDDLDELIDDVMWWDVPLPDVASKIQIAVRSFTGASDQDIQEFKEEIEEQMKVAGEGERPTIQKDSDGSE